jgi:sec-independent protein translocase protein TatC
LLKKIFQLRDKANPDLEKPFLEHLEDLRITISRIVVTLLIATIACFMLRDQLMEILRRPVEQVWVAGQTATIPPTAKLARPLDLESWEQAKRVAAAISPLTPAERDAFFRTTTDPNLRFHVDALLIYRAALELPAHQRDQFLAGLAGCGPELRRQIAALLQSGPNPLIDNREDLRMMGAFNPTEAFMLSIKLAFFAGIVVSFPLLLLFTLQFVLPGLHQHEKHALYPAMAVGFGLFLTGVTFAYFLVLPRVLGFFHDYAAEMGIANEWRIGYYISFATQFTLIFGLAFELPVVVMTLVKLGILGWETMRHTRAYAILAIFVVAAIITPTPDAFTLCLLAVPMVILYEICIWLAYAAHRKQQRTEAAEQAANRARLAADPHATEPETGETEDAGEPADPAAAPDFVHDPYADYQDPYANLDHPGDDLTHPEPEPEPTEPTEPAEPAEPTEPTEPPEPTESPEPTAPAADPTPAADQPSSPATPGDHDTEPDQHHRT